VRAAKILVATVLALGCLYAFGRFFLAQLGSGHAPEGAAGVVLAAPPDFAIEQRGEIARTAAARDLAQLLARRPGEPRLGIHFTAAGFDLYWLADRSDPGRPVLRELAAGPTGTRLETTWQGGLEARLAWAVEHGGFDAPGWPEGERKNLYH
jgi:hypothetical protein